MSVERSGNRAKPPKREVIIFEPDDIRKNFGGYGKLKNKTDFRNEVARVIWGGKVNPTITRLLHYSQD